MSEDDDDVDGGGRLVAMRLVSVVAALLTFAVGLVGNGAVLVVIGRNAHHIRVKSVANCYIVLGSLTLSVGSFDL